MGLGLFFSSMANDMSFLPSNRHDMSYGQGAFSKKKGFFQSQWRRVQGQFLAHFFPFALIAYSIKLHDNFAKFFITLRVF